MDELIEVTTTVETEPQARALADALLDLRLAACCQRLGPIVSAYWWQGRKETAQEWRLLIKTRRALWSAVERAIRERHPYDTPEILATSVTAVGEDYAAWVVRETTCPAP